MAEPTQTQPEAEIRKILHVDMDAFYASVEQRDNPTLKGKPVIVGGRPDSRGVVAAASYEARRFGVHSAMPSSQAYRLCPNALFVPPRFEAYKAVSSQIHEIFNRVTDLIEPLSLDEAYLDVTHNKLDEPYASRVAQQVRQWIYEETGLTASAGVSYNKFLAKIASDLNKPNGMAVIRPDQAEAFLASLKIEKFYGIGKATARKMHALNIYTGADLRALSLEQICDYFGKTGAFYYEIVRGIDNRPVQPSRIRKSLGSETTFKEDILDIPSLQEILKALCLEVSDDLKARDLKGRTITLKVKYADFTQITRSRTLSLRTHDAERLYMTILELLKQTEAGQRKIRLLGVTVSNFEKSKTTPIDNQLPLPFNR